MNMMVVKEGHGLVYTGCRNIVRRGIVINVFEDGIDIAPVSTIEADTKCYDDEGAVKEKHKDNVRLRDCPPPFSIAYQSSENGLYCYADMNNLVHIKSSDYVRYHVTVIDDGAMISESMMNEIKYHPWQEQPQKEFTHRGYRQGSDKSADISKGDDIQLE